MKEIKLTQEKVALVDDEDFEFLNQYKWYVSKSGNMYYAIRNITIQNQKKRRIIKMHREILGRKLKNNEQIDHINGNGVDNRKVNLRICNNQQNSFNSKKIYKGSSKYKGVHWHKNAKKWCAQITFNGKHIYLGCFENEVDAAKAYDLKAKELFGEFVRLNFS